MSYRTCSLMLLNHNKHFQIYKRFQQQAAFIEFSQQKFEEALELFKSGETDAREVTNDKTQRYNDDYKMILHCSFDFLGGSYVQENYLLYIN